MTFVSSIPVICVLHINFNMKVSHAWLQTFFEDTLPSAQELADIFTFHSFEVEGVEQVGEDWVIDIDVLPNRSSDCLCHRGIAREVSTLLSLPMKTDPLRSPLPVWEMTNNLTVTVADNAFCPRYMAAEIRGVTVRPSPKWLQDALTTLGQKSINNVVDATNYVMLNTGQPLHAFDFALLTKDADGKRNITVRLAHEDEEITTLTNDTYTLSPTHQVITDGVSGEALALAGIKGGKVAEVTEKTVDILLESANFNFVNVRKTSNELKLATDASLRFQNEPSVLLPAFALRDLIALITELTEGTLVGVADVFDGLAERDPIDVTLTEINTLLGTDLSISDVEKILVRFEWEFSLDGEEFAITGSWERSDLLTKEAFIEEIGRVHGYANITSQLPPLPDTPADVNQRQYYFEKIQRLLSDLGYSEVLTYTLADRGEVELINPLASDKAFLRMNIRDGLMKALDLNVQNAPLLGLDVVKIFELGTVFTKDGEEISLAIGGRAVSGKQSKVDAMVKEDIEKILEILDIKESITIHDGVFEISLKNCLALLPEAQSYDIALPWNTDARYTRWSSYPYMLRDISLWVPKGVSADDVFSIIKQEGTTLLLRGDMFDEFEKDGRVSYAWHLVFLSHEKTLTDTEIGGIMENITKKLQSNEGWEVR